LKPVWVLLWFFSNVFSQHLNGQEHDNPLAL